MGLNLRVDPGRISIVYLDLVEFGVPCQSFFIVLHRLELIVCGVNDSLEILEIILLRLQTLIASRTNYISNVRDFSVPVVAWKKNELDALVVHFFYILSPNA